MSKIGKRWMKEIEKISKDYRLYEKDGKTYVEVEGYTFVWKNCWKLVNKGDLL